MEEWSDSYAHVEEVVLLGKTYAYVCIYSAPGVEGPEFPVGAAAVLELLLLSLSLLFENVVAFAFAAVGVVAALGALGAPVPIDIF